MTCVAHIQIKSCLFWTFFYRLSHQEWIGCGFLSRARRLWAIAFPRNDISILLRAGIGTSLWLRIEDSQSLNHRFTLKRVCSLSSSSRTNFRLSWLNTGIIDVCCSKAMALSNFVPSPPWGASLMFRNRFNILLSNTSSAKWFRIFYALSSEIWVWVNLGWIWMGWIWTVPL